MKLLIIAMITTASVVSGCASVGGAGYDPGPALGTSGPKTYSSDDVRVIATNNRSWQMVVAAEASPSSVNLDAYLKSYTDFPSLNELTATEKRDEYETKALNIIQSYSKTLKADNTLFATQGNISLGEYDPIDKKMKINGASLYDIRYVLNSFTDHFVFTDTSTINMEKFGGGVQKVTTAASNTTSKVGLFVNDFQDFSIRAHNIRAFYGWDKSRFGLSHEIFERQFSDRVNRNNKFVLISEYVEANAGSDYRNYLGGVNLEHNILCMVIDGDAGYVTVKYGRDGAGDEACKVGANVLAGKAEFIDTPQFAFSLKP